MAPMSATVFGVVGVLATVIALVAATYSLHYVAMAAGCLNAGWSVSFMIVTAPLFGERPWAYALASAYFAISLGFVVAVCAIYARSGSPLPVQRRPFNMGVFGSKIFVSTHWRQSTPTIAMPGPVRRRWHPGDDDTLITPESLKPSPMPLWTVGVA